ncbi:DUF3341 domain-containing protein [bacterium]|nr:DUF3341 domain-containing protein [bacterium]
MSEHVAAAEPTSAPRLLGFLVEFRDTATLFSACEKVRDSGYRNWDAHTPYPVHGLNDAMGLKPSRLPYIAFLGGVTGLGLALLMQWWMNAIDYPYLISGKPIFSLPANIPVMFELTVLLAAFGTFFGMLAVNRLPRFHHPVFTSERFARATDDTYFISLELSDPEFGAQAARELAGSLGGASVEEIWEDDDAEA